MALDIMAAFTNEPPELDFIWPGFLAGTVGALVAPGATGKSFFALEAAMSIACSVAGGDLVGLAPAHTGRVVYLAGEDPQPALVRRVHAIGQHLNQSAREAIAENLMLEPIMGKRLNVMDEAHLRRVIDYSAGARLIVLDTLSRIHSLDENSNGDMAHLVSVLEHIAATTGAAVLYLHHVNKGSARDGQTDQQQAARGASALIDKGGREKDRSVIVFNSRITVKGIPEEAYDYMVNGKSAIEWVMDRYQVTKDKVSAIVDDPNDWCREHNDPAYILNLLKRVIRVSMETVKIVGGLPSLQ